MARLTIFSLLSLTIALNAAPAQTLYFDEEVTPTIIFGAGNDNGAFTVDQGGGVEVGLRGKLRFNESGDPENTFNSNGDGTYWFQAGEAGPGAAAEWSFEWSVNSDYKEGDSLGGVLYDYRYELGLDRDPSLGTDFIIFDPISPLDAEVYWDHSIGTNDTPSGGGTVAIDAGEYANLVELNNVAQNSWQPHWFIPGFDPTIDGNYTIYLTVLDLDDNVVASTAITILVGEDTDGDGVPDNADECVQSDLRDTVMIDGFDSGVPNWVSNGGCSISDMIAESTADAENHGQRVKAVAHVTNELKRAGVLSGKEKAAIQKCVKKSKNKKPKR